ncbi:MAG: sigma-70 family RNA polymerase sigma factor [Bryobacterales bacterium]|nr:sigma-70 family RNA polymerase sigma factor [Bryobacterales bacterium]
MIEEQTRTRLHEALTRLPEKNQTVLRGYYFEELSLEQIGERLGLSKSWVCRVHAKSLELLREELELMGIGDPASERATVSLALR